MSDGLRQSGRTTRMLLRAKQLHEERRAVYVLTHDAGYARALARHVRLPNSVKFEPISDLGHQIAFGDEGPRLRGSHPNCVVLIDHYAAERVSADIEREIQRLRDLQAKWNAVASAYDPPREQVVS